MKIQCPNCQHDFELNMLNHYLTKYKIILDECDNEFEAFEIKYQKSPTEEAEKDQTNN